MNLNITEEHAEEILLILYEAVEWFNHTGCGDDFPESDALRKDIINQIFTGFPSLEEKLLNKKMKHVISVANLYRD